MVDPVPTGIKAGKIIHEVLFDNTDASTPTQDAVLNETHGGSSDPNQVPLEAGQTLVTTG
jgi:hypothetical protein